MGQTQGLFTFAPGLLAALLPVLLRGFIGHRASFRITDCCWPPQLSRVRRSVLTMSLQTCLLIIHVYHASKLTLAGVVYAEAASQPLAGHGPPGLPVRARRHACRWPTWALLSVGVAQSHCLRSVLSGMVTMCGEVCCAARTH